jgi:hypothetical protein
MLEGIRSGDRRWQRSGGEESGGVAGIATSVQGEESGAAGTDAGKIWGRGERGRGGDCGLGAGRGERGGGVAAVSGGAVVDALLASLRYAMSSRDYDGESRGSLVSFSFSVTPPVGL